MSRVERMTRAAARATRLALTSSAMATPSSVRRSSVLGTSGHEGITGTLNCDENGDCADPKISVSLIGDGTYERIWPEE